MVETLWVGIKAYKSLVKKIGATSTPQVSPEKNNRVSSRKSGLEMGFSMSFRLLVDVIFEIPGFLRVRSHDNSSHFSHDIPMFVGELFPSESPSCRKTRLDQSAVAPHLPPAMAPKVVGVGRNWGMNSWKSSEDFILEMRFDLFLGLEAYDGNIYI